MKGFPQIDRFVTAVCSYSIPVLMVVFSSCQNDVLENDLTDTNALMSASLLTFQPFEDCQLQCIEEGSETYYAESGSLSESNGQQRTISYIYYNTETHFVVEATYQQNNSNTKANIDISINGTKESFSDVTQGSTASSSIELPEGWLACDIMEFSIIANFNNGQANPNSQNSRGGSIKNNSVNPAQNDLESGSLSYSLIGVCPPCEESFSYKENQDGSYTFTYISTESIEGAEVKLTCPHIADFEAVDGKQYEVNPGQSKGAPTVLTWTGDIEACTEITFELAFTADCEQTKSGNANIFTDFKVNGESKKGESENIVYQCPE